MVAFLDPKWLEILKSSGGQSTAAATACGSLLFNGALGAGCHRLIPWMIIALSFGLLLFGCLAIVACIAAVYNIVPVHKWIVEYINDIHTRRDVTKYIPHMTAHERRIIGYLIGKNQKQFAGEADGGYAATLIARGIIISAPPAQCHSRDFNEQRSKWRIPDLIWDVLIAHKDHFLIQDYRFHPGCGAP